MKKIILLFFVLLLQACIARNISQRGNIFEMEQLEEIHIGMTSRENVIKIIGYPTFESNFNKNVWIYYSYITKEILFFKPFIFEQRVLVLIFDEESDILRDMTLYNVNTNKYEILNLNTNYENNSDSIVKDILKNLGTFGVGK